jgi:hypothetical protein
MTKAILFFLLSVAFIFIDYRKNKNYKKSIRASIILLYIFAIGYSGGIATRAIAPLFFLHLLAVVASYLAFLYYLLKEKLLWYIFLVPLATIGIYIVLNFLDGSRYEAKIISRTLYEVC